MKPAARAAAALALALLPAACFAPVGPDEPPVMRWDHRPEAAVWTTVALKEAEAYDEALAHLVPDDIDTWCPGYREAEIDDRRAFWVGILSSLAKYESTWDPGATGGGGRWIGLTQIDPRSARWFGCAATTAEALKDGAANLACALRIASVQVPKDNMVAGDGRQGLGRDWTPFRKAEMRAEMASWTREQSYCKPAVRPATLSFATMTAWLTPAAD